MAAISLSKKSDSTAIEIEESSILIVYAISGGAKIEYIDAQSGRKNLVEVSNTPAEIAAISKKLVTITLEDYTSTATYINIDRIIDVYTDNSVAVVNYNKGGAGKDRYVSTITKTTFLNGVYDKLGYFNYAVLSYSGDTITLANAVGDVSAKFVNGKVITIYGALDENNDTYIVDSSTFGTETVITLAAGTGVSDDTDTTGRVMIKALNNDELETAVQGITDGTSSFDTISEKTTGSGVTVDGVLLKDGGMSGAGAISNTLVTDATTKDTGAIITEGGVGVEKSVFAGGSLTATTFVKAGAGAVGTPSVRVGADDTGLYQVSGVQTGFAQDGVLVATFDSLGMKIDSVRGGVQLGSTPVGTVAIAEYGDGRDFTTVLTLTNFIVGAIPAAAAALGVGNIVYAFPAGQHFELVSSLSSVVLTVPGTTVSTDTGLGSVIASGAVSVLSGTATFEDRLTGQTISAEAVGGAAVSALTAATAGVGTGISLNVAGSVKNVFLNSAGTWNVDNAGSLLCSGTIVLKWSRM